MRVTRITTREELGSVQGWSELANSCDASPFTWPSVCVPWWFEMGFGRLVGVAVEESGLLVGLAVVHDRVGDFGRHRFQFLGTGPGRSSSCWWRTDGTMCLRSSGRVCSLRVAR